MVGLVGALTPVLYSHVADRKEEIGNINKANTMLQLQRETELYLKNADNRAAITTGTTKTPGQISSNMASLNNYYTIGFKKNGDEISAVIVEKEGSGNDVKAAKIANLIGVSAGIKSAMDTDNAYGVNGLWKENLADYGVANVPNGSTVVTTQYNEEKRPFYSSELIVNEDIDMGDHSLKADSVIANKVCIGGDDDEHCREGWGTADSNVMLLMLCNEDLGAADSDYCKRAVAQGVVADCKAVADTYSAAYLTAVSGYYYLGDSLPLTKKVCYFINGELPSSAAQVINACNGVDSTYRQFACMYDWQTGDKYAGGTYEGKKYTANCQSIFNAANMLPTGYYTFTNNYAENGFSTGNPCVFASGKSANDKAETISQCKAQSGSSTTSAACALGHREGWTTSCAAIKSAGVTSSDFYKITTSSTPSSTSATTAITERACYFVSGALATNAQTVTGCNSDKAGSVACGYGYQGGDTNSGSGWNRNCQQVLTVSRSYAENNNITITTGLKAGNNNQTCYVGQGSSTVNCQGTADYCTHNKAGSSSVNSSYKYCSSTGTASGSCISTCNEDADCTAYPSENKNYCINNTCMNCVANGSTASAANLCCSGLRNGSTCVASCGNYGNSSGQCKTSCSTGSSDCVSGYYCNGSTCTNSCTYGADSNRNCCECSGTGTTTTNSCSNGKLTTTTKKCNGCTYTTTSSTTSCACGCASTTACKGTVCTAGKTTYTYGCYESGSYSYRSRTPQTCSSDGCTLTTGTTSNTWSKCSSKCCSGSGSSNSCVARTCTPNKSTTEYKCENKVRYSRTNTCNKTGCGYTSSTGTWSKVSDCACGCNGTSCASTTCTKNTTGYEYRCNGNYSQRRSRKCSSDGCSWGDYGSWTNYEYCDCGCSGGTCDSCCWEEYECDDVCEQDCHQECSEVLMQDDACAQLCNEPGGSSFCGECEWWETDCHDVCEDNCHQECEWVEYC